MIGPIAVIKFSTTYTVARMRIRMVMGTDVSQTAACTIGTSKTTRSKTHAP